MSNEKTTPPSNQPTTSQDDSEMTLDEMVAVSIAEELHTQKGNPTSSSLESSTPGSTTIPPTFLEALEDF